MTLTREDFVPFFHEFHGYEPFAWQCRLLDYVIDHERWPDRVAAPTGAGKTSVIDVHLFANALAHQSGTTLPRRLVMTVNRRSLIDDHAEHASRLKMVLDRFSVDADTGSSDAGGYGVRLPTVKKVAELLRLRAGAEQGLDTPIMAVHTVRGGAVLDRGWSATPTVCSVLCITPDMWGSRVLFRGYGTSRRARALEAGLLTRDCVLVVDEAHLNRQLLTTARRIAQLDAVEGAPIGAPVLQVVETTATPAGPSGVGTEVRVRQADLGRGAAADALRRRLATPKPVELRGLDVKRSDEGRLAAEFAEACRALANDARFGGAPVGCIVNTVGLARTIAATLQTDDAGGDGGSVIEVIGGQRAIDRRSLRFAHAKFLNLAEASSETVEAPPRFVVGTQALEVGVNIDFGCLVTELAPAAALVQRAGRVNRFGNRTEAMVVVMRPQYSDDDPQGPYEIEDLEAAATWLQGRQADPDGLAPVALFGERPPATTPRRVLYQRLEWADAIRLGRTSEDLAAAERLLPDHAEDLTLWLRDDLRDRAEAFALVRGYLPDQPLHASQVLALTPPLGEELFSVSLARLRVLAREYLSSAGDASQLVVFRRGKTELLGSERALHEGDILLLPSGTEILPRSRIEPSESSQVGLAGARDVYDVVMHEALSAPASQGQDGGYWQLRALVPGEVHEVMDRARAVPGPRERLAALRRRLLSWFAALTATVPSSGAATEHNDLWETVAELVSYLSSDEANASTSSLTPELIAVLRESEGRREAVDLSVLPGIDDQAPIFVLLRQRPPVNEEAQSVTSRNDVLLETHASAVEQRARAIAQAVGLGASASEAVTAAARHHDDGKLDPRFQAALTQKRPVEAVLAKSRRPSSARLRSELGLVDWRHEQLSAAMVWASSARIDDEWRRLVTWLVGTSHGEGRGSFDFDSRRLLPAQHTPGDRLQAAAAELFDDGGWDELHEPLVRRFGPWGLAYLEALVRSADQSVSAEGR